MAQAYPSTAAQAESELLQALAQTLASPGDSQRWHTMRDAYYRPEAANARATVGQALLQQIPDQGIPAFLRATFLSAATGERTYSALAGQLAAQIQPFNADRLMAFCVVEWGHIVMHGSDRSAFIEALHACHIPELMAQMGQTLRTACPAPLPARPVPWLRKVALLCPYIGSSEHPPSSMALQQLHLLQGMGLQVRLFSCQETRVTHAEQYFGSKATLLTPAPSAARLQQLAASGVDFCLQDDTLPLMQRWQAALADIAAFDPDLVLLIGLNSPLIAPLFALRPVLGLCVHATAPMAETDVWLSSNPALANSLATPWQPAFVPGLAHYHPFRVSLKAATQPRTRAEFGLSDDHLALVCAGFRLGSEIHGEWAARMVALLQANPQLVLMLVGGNGGLPPALAAVAPAQLRVLGHQADLRSILRCCDVYVNPARVGGGFSVAEAMAEGLPALALADGDGGDKLGPFGTADLNDYFDRLHALLADPALRQQYGAQLQQRFNSALDVAQSGPSLLAACELARQRFQARMQQG